MKRITRLSLLATLAAAHHRPCVSHAGFGPGVICAGHLNASLQNGVFFGPTHGTGHFVPGGRVEQR